MNESRAREILGKLRICTMSQIKFSFMFHRWKKPKIIRWMLYDMQMYSGMVCGLFTIGLQREANDKDLNIR